MAIETELVLVVQSRAGNGTLEVRYRGRLIGTVLHERGQGTQQVWLATPADRPDEHLSLDAAVAWLVEQAGEIAQP